MSREALRGARPWSRFGDEAGRIPTSFPLKEGVAPFAGRLVLLALLGALSIPAGVSPAVAGSNSGGFLILHCNQSLQFTTDGDFNGYSEIYDAKNAVTQVPGDGEGVVYFVLAAFDDFAMPSIKAVEFGVEMSSSAVQPFDWGPTGWDLLEVAQPFWPQSGTGTAISWTQPLDPRLNEIYWFAGYAYAGQTVKLTKSPLSGRGRFTDGADFSVTDEIEGYGMLGFGVKGYNPLTGELATGACCSSSGQCILQSENGCRHYSGYSYQGDNTACSPNPCTPGVGACCIRAECRMLQWDECLDTGSGMFMGVGVGCEPTPCDFSRVETTWGTLKSTYRDQWNH